MNVPDEGAIEQQYQAMLRYQREHHGIPGTIREIRALMDRPRSESSAHHYMQLLLARGMLRQDSRPQQIDGRCRLVCAETRNHGARSYLAIPRIPRIPPREEWPLEATGVRAEPGRLIFMIDDELWGG